MSSNYRIKDETRKTCVICESPISFIKWRDAQRRNWDPLCTSCITDVRAIRKAINHELA